MNAPPLQASPARLLDKRTKIFYGFGSVAFGIKDNGFNFLLLLFYNQVMGVPASWIAMVLIISLAIEACVDPVIGQFSDNLRTPWGRRHPLMYASVLPIALSYAALWNPPQLDQQGLLVYLLVLAVVVRTCVSLNEIPSSALSAEFSTDYEERSVLLAYRYFFAVIGAVSLVAVTFAFILTPDESHPVGQLNPAGYARYGIIAGAIMAISVFLSAVGTHRNIPKLMNPPERERQSIRAMLGEIRETLSNRSFLFVWFASVATAVAIGLHGAIATYLATFFWGFSADEISYMTLAVFMSAFIAFGVTRPLTRRFEKRKIAMTCLVLAGAFTVGPVALRLAGLMPPNGSSVLLAIIVLNQIPQYSFTFLALTTANSMIADVVEDAELSTGRRSEGVLFAASTFANKAVSGFGVLAASLVIDIVGLHSGTAPASIPAETLQRLGIVYVPTVLGLFVVALLLVRRYSITRASHKETLKRLAEAGSGTGKPRP